MLRLLITISTLFITVSAGAKEYRFNDFPTDSYSNSTLKQVNLDSYPDAEYLKDKLTHLIGRAPNFAGKYILAAFGCGTACQVVTIVDVDTGNITMPVSSSDGSCYSKNSKLLIINPYIANTYDEDLQDWAFTYYYIIQNGRLELLYQTKEPLKGECESGYS